MRIFLYLPVRIYLYWSWDSICIDHENLSVLIYENLLVICIDIYESICIYLWEYICIYLWECICVYLWESICIYLWESKAKGPHRAKVVVIDWNTLTTAPDREKNRTTRTRNIRFPDLDSVSEVEEESILLLVEFEP